jgi:FtsP/CotA-like multicopper oxidase with cupredoxin domain
MPGMDHRQMPGMDHGSMSGGAGKGAMPGMDHGNMPGMEKGMKGQDAMGPMPGMKHDMGSMPGMENAGPVVAKHGPDTHGPGNASVAMVQRNRLGEPGTGLANAGHRVLVYTDLKSLEPNRDFRPPEREIELHLTGNMESFIWGIDGKKFSEAPEPIQLTYGERVRVTLVNDTMMEHPMHMHGMFKQIANGAGRHMPRKHTINVRAAERLSYDFTVDEPGNWAFHCHMLYHMEAGMFRFFNVPAPAKKVAS